MGYERVFEKLRKRHRRSWETYYKMWDGVDRRLAREYASLTGAEVRGYAHFWTKKGRQAR